MSNDDQRKILACEHCFFWMRVEVRGPGGVVDVSAKPVGECHLGPGNVVMVSLPITDNMGNLGMELMAKTYLPTKHPHDWCGGFRPKQYAFTKTIGDS